MEKEELFKEQIDQMINEIKQIEQELYQKISHLAAYKSMEHSKRSAEFEALKKKFDAYIARIGEVSTGGNSVEDIRRERGR